MQCSTSTKGFTLLELMIVVAIIGILAAVAIPQFMLYQTRSRRTEAFMNLQALATVQKSYHAERDEFFETSLPYPDFTKYGGLGTDKMPWDAESQAAFSSLGWEPEGEVYYSYESNTSANCDATCDSCFTVSAFGDVDGNGSPSAVMYVHPEKESDGSLSKCKSNFMAFGVPSRFGTNSDVYNQVAVNRSIDEF